MDNANETKVTEEVPVTKTLSSMEEYQGTYKKGTLTYGSLIRRILSNDVTDVTTFRFLAYRLNCRLHRTGDRIEVYHKDNSTFGWISQDEMKSDDWKDHKIASIYVDEGFWSDSYTAFPNAETGNFCPPYIEVVHSDAVGRFLCKYFNIEVEFTGNFMGANRQRRSDTSDMFTALFNSDQLLNKMSEVLWENYVIATIQSIGE